MRLTVYTDYALRVLLVLTASRDRLLTIAEISAGFAISEAHLMKITHALARLGWVTTVRGRGGGMRLAIDPAQLSLRKIVQTLEHDFTLVECFGEGDRCMLSGGCRLEHALSRALQAFYDELEQYSLAELTAGSPLLGGIDLDARRDRTDMNRPDIGRHPRS